MNSDNNEILLTGGRVIDPFRNIDTTMDIGIANGVITEPEKLKKPKKIKLHGKVVAPGFIDMHVHLREPGNTAAETICSGTMAAAAGGFTSIVAMPNTMPAADTPGTVEYVRRHAESEGVVRVFPCGCMSKGLEGKEMAALGILKRAGVVALSDDGRCIQNHELMRHVVEYATSFGLPILDHCEDESFKANGVMHEGKWSVLLGMAGQAAAAEELIVARDIILSRQTGGKIHIQHISSHASIEQVRQARARSINITAEATPHHLALTDECIKRFDANYKMNPPLRSEEDRQSIIAGLADGTITVIATDHAPHTTTSKLVEFDYAPFGVVGLETAVSVCLHHLYQTGILSLSELIAKFTVGPAEVLGFTDRVLAVGNPADLTVLDIDNEFTVDAVAFKSRSRNTPFDGMSFCGRAVATIVAGRIVHSLLPGTAK